MNPIQAFQYTSKIIPSNDYVHIFVNGTRDTNHQISTLGTQFYRKPSNNIYEHLLEVVKRIQPKLNYEAHGQLTL